MEQSLALAAIPLIFLAAFGWGIRLERLIYGTTIGRTAYSVALGLLVWLGIGALLNYLSLATPIAFDVLLGSGVLFAFLEWKSRDGQLLRPALSMELLPVVIAVAAGTFFALGLVPASAMNFHDDFYKYLPRLVGMLQTGSLGGGSFDLVGIDSLGMQTFLQGFFVGHLPVRFVNAFDAVFCLLLSALLLDALGRELNIGWTIRSLAVLSFLVLNPQYVNVSALYSGMTMIIGMSFATLLFARSLDESVPANPNRTAIPIGLFAAAIAGLKVTLIPYAAGYLLVLLVLAAGLKGNRMRVLAAAAWALLSAVVLYGLWLGLSAQKLLNILLLVSERTTTKVTQMAAANAGYLDKVLAQRELFYGGHMYQYLGLLGMIGVLALMATVLLYRQMASRAMLLVAAATGIGCLVSSFGILIGVYGIHVDALVRYNTPMLIAGLPVVTILLYGAWNRGDKQSVASLSRPVITVVLALILAAPILMQGQLWLERVRLVSGHHHMLAFPMSAAVERNQENLLSSKAAEGIAGLQDKIPVGSTVLSWNGFAFHLDYGRNRILTVDSPTLFRGMANLPEKQQAVWLRRTLREAGVDYVLWAYSGNRPSWGKEKKILLDRALSELANNSQDNSQVIFVSRTIVLFSIKPRDQQ